MLSEEWYLNPGSHVITPATVRQEASIVGNKNCIFLVYGNEAEANAYVAHARQAEIRRTAPLCILPIGYCTTGELGVEGVVVTMTGPPREFTAGELKEVLVTTRSFASEVGATFIALAGQTPSIINQYRLPGHPSYVLGLYSSVWIVIATLQNVIRRHNLRADDITVGVAGAGFFGRVVIRYIGRDLGIRVIGYDPQVQQTSFVHNTIMTNDPTYLGTCDIDINLASIADNFLSVVPYCQKNGIFIEDAHPRSSAVTRAEIQKIGGTLYLTSAKRDGAYFHPPLADWRGQEIPGCYLEAIFRQKGHAIRRISDSFQAAEELGFEPSLIQI